MVGIIRIIERIDICFLFKRCGSRQFTIRMLPAYKIQGECGSYQTSFTAIVETHHFKSCKMNTINASKRTLAKHIFIRVITASIPISHLIITFDGCWLKYSAMRNQF